MNYGEIINNKYSEPAAVIAFKDGRIRLVEINGKFIPELWMNVSKDDYIRAYPEKCFDDDNMEVFVKALKKCADTGEEQTVETWRSVFSDCCGFDKVCLRSRLVLIEKDRDEAFIYEAVQNISNEKRTKNTLDDIEYRYKQASEQINIYNWEYIIATKDMRPCYRCMRDLGMPAVVHNYPEPAIDMGIFPPDYADMYRDMMKKIDEGIPEIEADIPLTVGRVPFRVKYTTAFDENGKPYKAFGSATLISETELGHIKLDNQIIATLAEEYRCIYLVDFVEDTVKIVKQEDIMSVREGASCSELLEYTAAKIHEASVDREGLSELFRDADKREFVYKDDESERWIRIEYQVVERGNSEVDRLLIMVSVVDDLRAQKMDADRLIASQKKELEDRQKLLLQAVDEADRANKAKTEFFTNMSHDIRTPMNAIVGFSKLALEDIDNKEQLKDHLDKIDAAGDHLLKLINDILDMSAIESGKMELAPAPVNLKKVLLDCADMIRIKMDDNRLNFTVEADGMGDDIVECDKLRLNQVLLNLLSNAYKYTPEGGSVSLSGRLLDRSDVLTYEIRVKDTGIGMSDEFREHIWEAYEREKTDVVREIQGTGLGMVIVKKIVDMMNGTIELQSKPGEGSEFIMVLPMAKVGDECNDDNKSNGSTGNKNEKEENVMEKDYSGISVLVVDDTSVNLKLADRLLSKFGFEVKTVTSGTEAVEQVQSSRPGDIDLILMDVKMPVMDGLEATRRIRALEDPALAGMPIIAMTANAFEADIREALEAGMNAHVPKPFKMEELLTVIDENLR